MLTPVYKLEKKVLFCGEILILLQIKMMEHNFKYILRKVGHFVGFTFLHKKGMMNEFLSAKKIENFDCLNVVFISYKLTMWD